MSQPFGKSRCIAINAARGKDPLLPAKKAIDRAVAKLKKAHGIDILNVSAFLNDDQINGNAAKRALADGKTVRLVGYAVTREGADFFDPGEFTTHECEVRL